MNYSLPVGYQVYVGMSEESAEMARKLLGKSSYSSCLAIFAQIPKLGDFIILEAIEGRDKNVFRVDLVMQRDVTNQGYAGTPLGIDKSHFYPELVAWAYIEVSYVKTIQFQDFV